MWKEIKQRFSELKGMYFKVTFFMVLAMIIFNGLEGGVSRVNFSPFLQEGMTAYGNLPTNFFVLALISTVGLGVYFTLKKRRGTEAKLNRSLLTLTLVYFFYRAGFFTPFFTVLDMVLAMEFFNSVSIFGAVMGLITSIAQAGIEGFVTGVFLLIVTMIKFILIINLTMIAFCTPLAIISFLGHRMVLYMTLVVPKGEIMQKSNVVPLRK